MTPYIDYIRWHTGFVVNRVRCKGGCTKVLIHRRGIAQNFRVDKTDEYGEVVLELRLPNGLLGKHETAMCYDCRKRLHAEGPNPGELEAIYAQDVYQWIESAIMESHLTREDATHRAARFATYVPTRVLDEPSRGATYF